MYKLSGPRTNKSIIVVVDLSTLTLKFKLNIMCYLGQTKFIRFRFPPLPLPLNFDHFYFEHYSLHYAINARSPPSPHDSFAGKPLKDALKNIYAYGGKTP